MLNLRVELPIESRLLYRGNSFNVVWLALPGDEVRQRNGEPLLVQKEYGEKVDKVKVLAEARKADEFLSAQPFRWPKNFKIENVGGGYRALVIKAPNKGNRIYRLICYREGTNYFMAVAREKKDKKNPNEWFALAQQRIGESLRHGGP